MTEIHIITPKEVDAISRAYVRAFMRGIIDDKTYWLLFAELIKDIPKVKEPTRTIKQND